MNYYTNGEEWKALIQIVNVEFKNHYLAITPVITVTGKNLQWMPKPWVKVL